MKELLTVTEVAMHLKVNKNTVYSYKKAGLLKFMKLGKLKCREQDLEEFKEWCVGKDVTDPFNVKILEENWGNKKWKE